jgi:hypothetical protein
VKKPVHLKIVKKLETKLSSRAQALGLILSNLPPPKKKERLKIHLNF